MGRLTTHVLDTASGKPAAGMRIDLAVLDGNDWRHLKTLHANADGRTDEPVLAEAVMTGGQFRLLFHVADYYRGKGMQLPDPPFLGCVPLCFGIADTTAHYHVPLLCSPWSYSTYRGS
jgi:5-hydroxyisourate hydrolase